MDEQGDVVPRCALYCCQQQLELLADSVNDYAIFLLDGDGNVTSWNTGAERITGYDADEMLGRHFSRFYTDEDVAMQKPQQQLAQASQIGRSEAQLWQLRRDGTRFLANLVITPILDQGGTPRGFARVTHDISTHHAAEQRLRQVVESAPSAMVMIGSSGIIEMVNVQAERVFGYARNELLHQPVEILVPDRFSRHHPEARNAFFREPLARPMGQGRDLYARRKDGSEFPVEIGLNPIETDEGTKVLSAIVDISDRKQKEQNIQAALEEKNLLLGEIHHRVKNNLQIVHSLLDLQSTRISDASVLEMLRDSQNRIRSMALIHQSLYLSSNFARVNIGNVMEALIPALLQSYSVDHNRIHYELDVADVLLPINLAIPCGLIINELISNALKHAFPGTRAGVIRVAIKQQTGNKVLLSVSDDGIGIESNADLQQTNTLGLQLVRLLADQLGATLSINRANPTCFALEFATESPA
jgi:PAS domain S-box-containing protein